MKEVNEEKYEKALEWLENAMINLDNVSKVGVGLVPLIRSQIENAIKYLKDEDVEDGVMGSIKL